MIGKALKDIKEYLVKFINDPYIHVNTSAVNCDNAIEVSGIIITLLHIEEESSLKQQIPTLISKGNVHSVGKANPEMWINLYVMFSAVDKDYDTALHNISTVIRAFQANNVIHSQRQDELYRIYLNKMPMEQYISLWQSLGGKMMPSVVYKIQMLHVQESIDIVHKHIVETNVTILNTTKETNATKETEREI